MAEDGRDDEPDWADVDDEITTDDTVEGDDGRESKALEAWLTSALSEAAIDRQDGREANALEAWLTSALGRDPSPTRDASTTRGDRASDAGAAAASTTLDAWLSAELASVPMPGAPVRSAALELEDWVTGTLCTAALVEPECEPVPQTLPPQALVAAPAFAPMPRLVGLEATSAATASLAREPLRAPKPEPPPSARNADLEPLDLELFANIKLALWSDGLPLIVVLERFGVDELRWRRNEEWQRRQIAEEAAKGDRTLANALTAALRKARGGSHATPRPTIAKKPRTTRRPRRS